MVDRYKEATNDNTKKVRITALPSNVFFLHNDKHKKTNIDAPINPVLNKKC